MSKAVPSPERAPQPRRSPGPNDCWRLWFQGLTLEVVAPRRAFARRFALLFGAYRAAPPGTTADVRIRLAPAHGVYWEVATEGLPYVVRDSRGVEEAALRAEGALAVAVVRRLGDLHHVHAAVVATPIASFLLVGECGSGKSTTSVALAQAGLLLYTDDVALFDRERLRPIFVPRPIKLDARSRQLLRRRGLRVPPEVRVGESVARATLPGLPPLDEPGPPLAGTIFLTPARAAQPALRRLTAAEAAMRLAQHSASDGFGSAGPAIGAFAMGSALPSYELTAGDLDATVNLLMELIG